METLVIIIVHIDKITLGENIDLQFSKLDKSFNFVKTFLQIIK